MEPSHFWDAVFLIKILVLLASYANAVPYRTTLATIIPSTHVTQVVESTIPPPLFLPPHQNIQDTSDEIKYEWNWCAPYCDAALKPKPKQDDAKTINTRQDNGVSWESNTKFKRGDEAVNTLVVREVDDEHKWCTPYCDPALKSANEPKRMVHIREVDDDLKWCTPYCDPALKSAKEPKKLLHTKDINDDLRWCTPYCDPGQKRPDMKENESRSLNTRETDDDLAWCTPYCIPGQKRGNISENE